MWAVSVRMELRGERANCMALPASIVGISASPSARPRPSTAADSMERFDRGRATRLRHSRGVMPRAAAVSDVCATRLRTAPSMTKVMVGRPWSVRTRHAASQQKPVPPSAPRMSGTRTKTAAKP